MEGRAALVVDDNESRTIDSNVGRSDSRCGHGEGLTGSSNARYRLAADNPSTSISSR